MMFDGQPQAQPKLLFPFLLLLTFHFLSTTANPNTVNLGLFLRLSTWDSTTNQRTKKGPPWEVSAATALIAVDHFNDRNGAVVPAFATLPTTCRVQFVPHFFDTQSHPKPSMNAYLQANYDGAWKAYKPEVIVGASRSAVSTPLAMLTGLNDVPQISYLSTSTELDNSNTYSSFLRTIPSDAITAKTIVQLLHNPPYNVLRLSVVYVNDAYGTSFMEALQEACVGRGIVLTTYAFSFGNTNSIDDAVEAMAKAESRYVVAIVFDDDLEYLMKRASAAQIVGKGMPKKDEEPTNKWLWLFTDSIQSVKHVQDVSAVHALQGALRVFANGKGPKVKGWLKYQNVWNAIKTTPGKAAQLIAKYNTFLPPLETTDPNFQFQLADNFFDLPLEERLASGSVGDGAPFIFDAIASLGLAACAAAEQESGDGTGESRGSVIHRLAKSNVFEGVSGDVAYNEQGSRSAQTSRIEM